MQVVLLRPQPYVEVFFLRRSLGLPPDPKFTLEQRTPPKFDINFTDQQMKKIIVDIRSEITMKRLKDIQENREAANQSKLKKL